MPPKARASSCGKSATRKSVKDKGAAGILKNSETRKVASHDDSEVIELLLRKVFKKYDLDNDDKIERLEWLDGEEKRLSKRGFGIKERKQAVAWFRAAGADGNLEDGMFLTFEKFKPAYLSMASSDSGISLDEPALLADWISSNVAEMFQELCLAATSPLNPAEPLAVAVEPTYPLACELTSLEDNIEMARRFRRNVLVLTGAADNIECVETYLKYRNFTTIDCKQIIAETLVKKSRTKEEWRAELGSKLRSTLNVQPAGFCRPVWIHMSNTAFDWCSFCFDEFPDEVFSCSRWTPENACKRGIIAESQKINVEIEDGKKWQDFGVVLTSRFDLEGAATHLVDKIPFYNELAVLVIK